MIAILLAPSCVDAGRLQMAVRIETDPDAYYMREEWRACGCVLVLPHRPRASRVRDEHKFERMMAFGKALPQIHRRIARDLRSRGMPCEKVLSTLVRLLESTLIRVGNAEYARTNRSYGLTTLRSHHVKLKGNVVRVRFRGKHGIEHEIEVEDPRAAKVLKGCLDLPGQELFEYVDDDGTVRNIGSSDVNDYLREVAGESFTAKDFRIWHATSEALEGLAGRRFASAREAKEQLKEVLQTLAGRLGNTAAMCRKCYVNPLVVDAFSPESYDTPGCVAAATNGYGCCTS